MTQVAIIVSPGHNTEVETLRELRKIGLDAKIYRWNEDPKEIRKAESFLIPGGFSYEDRGRAGLISAQNPIMQVIQEEADKGKPVIGICNGAQGLVELTAVPGDKDRTKALALAKNKRVKDGKILGTGYYNEWVYVKLNVEPSRTPFTHLVNNKPYAIPVAHGEGRYTTTYSELPDLLEQNHQVVFQYCDEKGQVDPHFPVNPNGAMLNAASICNPQGNVVSIMPHPERGLTAPVLDMFKSLKHHLENKIQLTSFPSYKLEPQDKAPQKYEPKGNELIIKEIITDNERYTLQNTLRKILNNPEIELERYTHYDIQGKITDEIHKTGELYNSNKEASVEKPQILLENLNLLIQYRLDSEGQSIQQNLKNHHGITLNGVTKGTLWIIKNVDEENRQKIIDSTLFYNINSQVAYEYI